MQFRLNIKHKYIAEGQKRRGKKTIAKENLYKYILAKIRLIKPNFNIGVTTGCVNVSDRWNHAYRHWNFRPIDFDIDRTQNKKSSVQPT